MLWPSLMKLLTLLQHCHSRIAWCSNSRVIPQTDVARIIRSSSLAAMSHCWTLGYFTKVTWNQLPLHRTMQPHFPEASDHTLISGAWERAFRLIDEPFHATVKVCHHCKPAWNVLLWCTLGHLPNLALAMRLHIFSINHCPGLSYYHWSMTEVAYEWLCWDWFLASY